MPIHRADGSVIPAGPAGATPGTPRPQIVFKEVPVVGPVGPTGAAGPTGATGAQGAPGIGTEGEFLDKEMIETALGFTNGTCLKVVDGVLVAYNITEDDILPGFSISSFARSGSSVYEAGATVSGITHTAAYSSAPTSAVVTDTDANSQNVTGTPNTWTNSASWSKSTNTTVTITLTANVGGSNRTRTVTIPFGFKVFSGKRVDPGVYTEAVIEGLATSTVQQGRGRDISTLGVASEYAFYAAPASYGSPSFIDLGNGLPITGDLVASNVNVTNTYGVTVAYNVWRIGAAGSSATFRAS